MVSIGASRSIGSRCQAPIERRSSALPGLIAYTRGSQSSAPAEPSKRAGSVRSARATRKRSRESVGDRQHGLEPAQDPVGAPVLGELDSRALELSLMLVELRLEALEERERVRGCASEAGENLVAEKPAHFARGRLDHDVSESDLSVSPQSDAGAAADRKDRGAVESFHEFPRDEARIRPAPYQRHGVEAGYCTALMKCRGEMPI